MKKTTTTGGGCIRSVPTYKSAGVIAGADIAGKAQSHGEADETDLSERVKLETGFHVSPCGLLAVFDTIAKLMLEGYDVRITDRCRFYACVNKSRSQLEVAVQAMGRFRQAMAETPFAFVSKGENLCEAALRRRSVAQARMRQEKKAQAKARPTGVKRQECRFPEEQKRQECRFPEAPETVVACPRCGHEFKVGKSLV